MKNYKKEDILSVYLNTDTSMNALSSIALNEFVLKIFYLSSPEGLSFDGLEKELQDIIGEIQKERIKSSIQELIKNKKIYNEGGKFCIQNEYKKKIEKTVNCFHGNKDIVIKKYFSSVDSNEKIIKDWFDKITISLVEKYYQELFYNMTRKKEFLQSSEESDKLILDSLREEKDINEKDRIFLKKQYIEFLKSNEPETNKILWDFGMSKFSSILLSYNNVIGDFTIDIFKDSRMILDTNVLMLLTLEEDEYYSFLPTLENFFEKFNIQLEYFSITKEEYIRAMSRLCDEMQDIFEAFSREKTEEMKIKNQFFKTAILRGCSSSEDIKTFFETMNDIPSVLSQKTKIIQSRENESLLQEFKKGYSDNDMKQKLSEKISKTQLAIEHDASMIAGVEFINKKETCWLITRDWSVEKYCIENQKRDDYSIAMHLGNLINIICIESGKNKERIQEKVVDIFSNTIKLSLLPEPDTYKIEDISTLIRVNEQISALPDDKIDELLKKVNQLRMQGVKDKDIALCITRTFSKYVFELQTTTTQLSEKARKEEEKNARLKKNLFNSEMKQKQIKYCVEKFFWNFLAFIVAFPIPSIISKWQWNLKSIIIGIGLAAVSILILQFILPNTKKRLKKIEDKIKKDIEDEHG